MTSNEPTGKLSRRDFLLFALAGTGSVVWLFTRQNTNFLGQPPASSLTPTSALANATSDLPTPTILSSVGSDTIQPTEVEIVSSLPTATLNQQRAELTYQAVVKNFAIPGQPLFIEAINPKDDKYTAYLWPYSGILAAVAALGGMNNRGSLYASELERLLPGLDAYYDATNRPPAWQSYLLEQGGGERYYDDNEWIGLLYLDAYRLVKKDFYLAKAIEAFNYSVSGWSEEAEGGIYWKEFRSNFDHKTKNTCSNAPAAVMALEIYQENRQDQYLQWAQRIMNWMARLKSPEDGLYWDNIDKDGFIDKRMFTYNTGAMIHANALLHTISNDSKYLEEARSLAEASYQYFPKDFNNSGIALYHGDPWFVTVLMRGYLALYSTDPAKDRKYIDHMRKNLDYAWENARDTNGLFNRNWQGPANAKTAKKVLDQAAMVELYALASHLDT